MADRFPDRARLDADLATIADWAGDPTPPGLETLDEHPVVTDVPAAPSHQAWPRLLATAAAFAVVGAGVWAFTANRGDTTNNNGGGVRFASDWIEASPSPLSPRSDAISVWTGREVIVFAGNEQIPCPVCDYFEPAATLSDGAAYDPANDSWRRIADLPDDASYLGSAIAVDGDVIHRSVAHPDQLATTTESLWRYSVADDQWRSIPFPQRYDDASRLVAGRGGFFILPTTDTRGAVPDQWFDLATEQWSELPADPFEGESGREFVFADGRLVVFSQAYETLENTAQVPFWRTATFDPSIQQWTIRSDVDFMMAPSFAHGSELIAPFTGGLDGGDVNNWGRTVPNGGIYDLDAGEVRSLPQPEPADGMGVVGADDAWFGNMAGSVLDLSTSTWHAVPLLPDGLSQQFGATVTAMGTDLFTFGGGGTITGEGTLHNRAFVWHTGGTAESTTPPTDTASPATP